MLHSWDGRLASFTAYFFTDLTDHSTNSANTTGSGISMQSGACHGKNYCIHTVEILLGLHSSLVFTASTPHLPVRTRAICWGYNKRLLTMLGILNRRHMKGLTSRLSHARTFCVLSCGSLKQRKRTRICFFWGYLFRRKRGAAVQYPKM